MTGVNKAIILGNVGNAPEVHKANSGATITVMSVATSEKWKDKQTGQMQERTEWHRVKFFGKLADVVAQYVQKGSKVFVEGKINTEKYQAADGSDRYSTCIIGQSIEFLDAKGDSGAAGGSYQNKHSQAQQQGNQSPPADDFDDDIPF